MEFFLLGLHKQTQTKHKHSRFNQHLTYLLLASFSLDLAVSSTVSNDSVVLTVLLRYELSRLRAVSRCSV